MRERAYAWALAVYVLLGVSMWTTPLLSIVHVESSAVVATAAFFIAGISSCSLLRAGAVTRRVAVLQLSALLLPWLLLTLSVLWQPNCDYLRGLLFYLIYPGVTVVFAVSVARLLSVLPVRRPGTWLVVMGILVIVLPPLYDLGLHPQFYTYNHVFGGFLGPIYDEQLSFRPGLFAFRLLTLLWSALFLVAARWKEAERSPLALRLRAVALAGCIAAVYLFAPALGIITTPGRIEGALGGVERTRHFEIYYDEARTTDAALARLVDEHEYRYAELQDALGIDVDAPIRSYIYPNADVKAQLTGARYTNVAPVWLPAPQMHVLASDFARVFPHELVHVFSRPFGLPLINASISIGLVEGLAVALQPPDGGPGPHEQVSAALLSEELGTASGASIEHLENVVASHLSAFGFWTGRGAVSYTTMGSFVRYLMDTYGPEPFMGAYATAGFRKHYGKSPEVLAAEWTRHVLSLDAVARSTGELVAARFAVPSLFEKECPHYVPPHARLHLDARRALGRGDSTAALHLVSRAVALQNEYVPALELWAGMSLLHGDAASVFERLGAMSSERLTAALLIRMGDALALLGRADEARRSYDRARARLPSFAHETRALLRLRRSLAHDGERVRTLIGALEPDPQAPLEEDADRLAVGLALARSGRYEQSIDLMRRVPTLSISGSDARPAGELARRRLVWLADISYDAGDLGDAAAYADSASHAYRAVGAFGEADAQRDFYRKTIWLTTEQMERIAEEGP
jgi:tetratricopeptide (TPR) repeat protein